MRAIKTVIPFKPDNPKSRLSPVLTEEKRKAFVGLSLQNVLAVLKESGIKQVDILSKSALDKSDENRLAAMSGSDFEIKILIDESDLNTAVNTYLKSSEIPVLIVMADLALLKKEDVEAMTNPAAMNRESAFVSANCESEFIAASVSETKAAACPDIVRIAPGKDGGTNMMYISTPADFEVNYYGESCKKHQEEALRRSFICEIHKSFYAAADMDEPSDLNDILNHGSGEIFEFISKVLKP
ncbi:Phosphoenolpyruvate guanylyltransferase [Methanimicrococcus stummii]|uniref:2-phospho-L-lactate guanylyltransferase n=1 Tax=Methanimicrococcus stummii TaxID=3028294 RepID=A0AA96ZYD0_9EURY|nr:2-phospho-L-lactate guanylyltransferase [Methanimicrococcus sp. Es2]WNY28716.1 Phosphoenolpyruvate guanylyltransferase [Methanimicrococcus sp. Es2]